MKWISVKEKKPASKIIVILASKKSCKYENEDIAHPHVARICTNYKMCCYKDNLKGHYHLWHDDSGYHYEGSIAQFKYWTELPEPPKDNE